MSGARESQGYVIAVIILVLLSLVLALVAFLGWSSAGEHASVREKLEDQQKFNEAYLKIEDYKIQALLGMIGDEGKTPDDIKTAVNLMNTAATSGTFETSERQQLNDLVANFRKIEERYQAEVLDTLVTVDGVDVKQATYRQRIRNLVVAVGKKVNENNIQIRQTVDAENTAAVKIKEKDEQLKVAEDAALEAQKLLAETNAAKLASEKELKEELASATEKLTEKIGAFDEFKQVSSKMERDFTKQVLTLDTEIADLQRRIRRFTSQSYEYADARITNVSSPLHTVFLDIGANDGLAVNRTFSIYDASVTNFEDAPIKGSIEIISLRESSCEARIKEEDPTNPILRGDQALSPTWDPGVTVRYALSGRFDLDGDKFDDTDKLIREIERNGGKVVVRHDEEGNISGELNTSIDFLVEGNTSLIDESGVINAMKQMKEDAEKYTVTELELDKLLKQMGLGARITTKKYDLPPGGFSPRPSKNSDR